MTSLTVLLAQTVLTTCLAGWMISAVYNNWRFPRLNGEAVGQVMRFDFMERDYPEDYAFVRHRKIESKWMIQAGFKVILFMETVAALVLSVGAILMVACLFGLVSAEVARFVAVLGTLLFILVWTGFLIGGEYFCYWYCHFGSQATHLMLAIWGTIVLGLLLTN